MNSTYIAMISFSCIFSGALVGLRLRRCLPAHHLSSETLEIAKLGAGLMGTLAALILGLLVSTAKGTLDGINHELREVGAKIILLDRALANYGPESRESREILRGSVVKTLDQVWPEDRTRHVNVGGLERSGNVEKLQDSLNRLSPANPYQSQIKAQAVGFAVDLARSRWVILEETQQPLPGAFLAILLFWLAALFACFGLLSPSNATAVFILFICAISLTGAIFLIIEMSAPLTGIIKVSSAPLQKALANIGR